MDAEQIMDYLTVSVSKNKLFSMVDRENLRMIINEQKLNQEDFIDENQARRLGELLWGGRLSVWHLQIKREQKLSFFIKNHEQF